MVTVDKNEIIVDGKSEMIITHSKKRILIELLFFLFWAAIGIALIVFGSLLISESLGLRIPIIVIGSLILIIFFESFLAKLTNRIILNQEEIKTRVFIRWFSLAWSEIDTIEIEKRASSVMKRDRSPRTIMMKFTSNGEYRILYPLFRFVADEAENIVVLIKEYYKANRGIELNEKAVNFSGEKELDSSNDSDENRSFNPEQDIESQIPPRVEDYEIEDAPTEPST